jgi:hypothetical protein
MKIDYNDENINLCLKEKDLITKECFPLAYHIPYYSPTIGDS